MSASGPPGLGAAGAAAAAVPDMAAVQAAQAVAVAQAKAAAAASTPPGLDATPATTAAAAVAVGESQSADGRPKPSSGMLPPARTEADEDLVALFVGDLDQWMDECYLNWAFSGRVKEVQVETEAAPGLAAPAAAAAAATTAATAENFIDHVKVIRDRQSFRHAGYGFVYFRSTAAAAAVLAAFEGRIMPGAQNTFKLNWSQRSKEVVDSEKGTTDQQGRTPASFTVSPPDPAAEPASGSGDALFVGDLAYDVTDGQLLRTFQFYYPSVYAARAVMDVNTGRSKGFGFVHFGDNAERDVALGEMNGFYLSTRPINVNVATKRESTTQSVQHQTRQVGHTGGHQGGHGGQMGGHMGQMGRQQPQHQQGNNNNQRRQQGGAQFHQGGESGSQNNHNNTTIFVGGVDDATVTASSLSDVFGAHGTVIGVRMLMGKSCAFIEYSTHDEAVKVMRLIESGEAFADSNIWAPGGQIRVGWGQQRTGGGAAGNNNNNRGGNNHGNNHGNNRGGNFNNRR